MRIFTKAALALLGGLFAATGAAATAEYSNHRGTDSYTWWGSNQIEDYDVAVRIDNPEFIGLSIQTVTFHVADTDGVEDFNIWGSKSLTLDNKVNAPDMFSAPVSAAGGTISYSFDTPCEIGEDGLYLGYSFSVTKKEEQTQKKPVAVIKDESGEYGHNFYLHTSKTYGKWIDNGEKSNLLIPFELTLSGLEGENVTVVIPSNVYGSVGNETPVNAVMTNLGYAEVRTAIIHYETSGSNGDIEVECTGLPAKQFLTSSEISFCLPATDVISDSELRISVKSVNGKTNVSAAQSADARLEIFSRLPRRTPLLEEYTGTGCGWCPRGGVGLEKMTEIYGDRFVGLAYHCADIMSIFEEKDYPSPAPAQPVAWIDRTRETDPYLGDMPLTTPAFGIDLVWEEAAQRFTPADMSLACHWVDENRNAIEVKVTANFVKSYDDADFRMVYILVEDGLTGTGPEWTQGNYYSGETGKWPDDLQFLVDAPRAIPGFVYNDVAIFSTDPKGVAGSIPSKIEADHSYDHSINLTLSEAVNISGDNLVQDMDRISVVAAIIDSLTGEIVNCAKVKPGFSGIESVSDNVPTATEYYNLQGIKIPAPEQGRVSIMVTTSANGSRKVTKVM